MRPKHLARLVLLATAGTLLGGCVTPMLWQDGQFARYHEPAHPINLRLFYSDRTKDVLAEYTEVRDGDAAMRNRAFWLEPNAELLRERRRPDFVSLKAERGLTPIAVMPQAAVARPLSNVDLYAVVATNGCSFTLCSAGKEIGSYELPVYRDASGRVKQVLLTPLAVTADLSIVGAIAGVIVAYAYAGASY